MNEFEEYADWYVWAKRNLSTDPGVCHGAADAATAAASSGAERPQAIAAARQSLTSAAHLGVAASDVRRRTYAEWFDWARRELGGVREQQHAAAQAALATLDAGQGANAATAAARAAYGPEPGTAPAPMAAPQPQYAPPPAPPAAPSAAAGAGPQPYFPPPPVPPAHWGYAGFWRRTAAWLIDTLLIGLVIAFPTGLIVTLMAVASGQQTVDPVTLDLIVYPLAIVVAWLYFTLAEASSWQATLGKLALQIKVTDLHGQRIGWGRANARFWSKLISNLTCGLLYLMVAFTERKQGLHDMIAATLVVRA